MVHGVIGATLFPRNHLQFNKIIDSRNKLVELIEEMKRHTYGSTGWKYACWEHRARLANLDAFKDKVMNTKAIRN